MKPHAVSILLVALAATAAANPPDPAAPSRITRTVPPAAAQPAPAASSRITRTPVSASARNAARPAPARAEPAPEEPSFYDDWIAKRLSIGLALTYGWVRDGHVSYDSTQKHNFIGNINDMDERDGVAVGLVARYAFLPWLAVEAANDFRCDLDAQNMDGASCDGTLKLRSWRLQAILLWPDETWAVRPWAGIGIEDVSASFSHAPWWHYGWSSPEDYARYGQGSKKPHNGAMRTMSVEDPGIAPVLSLGVTAELHRNVRLDVFGRWTGCDDVSVTFTRTEGHRVTIRRTGAFPAEHFAVGVALRAVF